MQPTLEGMAALVRVVETGSFTRAAALAGLGLVTMPSWMVVDEVARGDLVQVLEDWHSAAIGIYAVYPSNRLLSAKVKVFSDLIARRVRDLGLTE